MKNRSTKTEQPLSYLLKCDETARTYLNILNQFATANGLPFETEHQQRKVLNLYERSAAPKN